MPTNTAALTQSTPAVPAKRGPALLMRVLPFLINFGFKAVIPLVPDAVVRGLGKALFSKSWRKFEADTSDPRRAQMERLWAILARNQNTDFGKGHGFAAIKTIADYQRAVPIRAWDDFAPYVERMTRGERNVLTSEPVLFYARSSGTTGTPKNIPITPGFMEEFRVGRRVWMRACVDNFPGLVRGKMLTIHSPKVEGHTADGTPYGSITVAFAFQNRELDLDDKLQDIPMDIFFLEDFDTKYYLILRFALQTSISIVAAINPSTVILFCKKINEFAGELLNDLENGTIHKDLKLPAALRAKLEVRARKAPKAAARMRKSRLRHGYIRPIDVWPKLCGTMSWRGGSAPFYLAQFPKYFGALKTLDYGFAASEGNFSVPLSADGAESVLAVGGHFMEFLPVDHQGEPAGEPLPAWALTKGGHYKLILTGSHGLYRYDINDIIECTGFYRNTPKVIFRSKGGNMLSITGEKVAEVHVVHAVTRAAAATGIELAGFTATVRLADPPSYLFAAEPRGALTDAQAAALAHTIDQNLAAENLEYEAKRKSKRLAPAALGVLPPGTFDAYRAKQIAEGAPDSHLKPPHLMKSEERLAERLGPCAKIYG